MQDGFNHIGYWCDASGRDNQRWSGVGGREMGELTDALISIASRYLDGTSTPQEERRKTNAMFTSPGAVFI